MKRLLISRTTQRIVDLLVLSIAFWLGFLIRFDGEIPLQYVKRSFFLWPYVVGMQYLALAFFGVPRFSWRYVGLREVTRILWAITLSCGVLLGLRLGIVAVVGQGGYTQYLLIPIGTTIIDYVMAFLGIVGVRVLYRLFSERRESRLGEKRASARVQSRRTLLIGAGQAGVIVAKEIARRPNLGFEPVGFVDDDASKLGMDVHGLRVLGTTTQLADLVDEQEIEQVIVTIANASGQAIRRITGLCEEAGLSPKIIPGIYELLDGRVNLNRLRDVSIEDLLRREVVDLEGDHVRAFLSEKCVMVTGAGGSIGSEICRQVARLGPSRLVLVERAEQNLFAIHHELVVDFPSLKLVPALCDICDRDRVEAVFREHGVQVVFHAAAHKHVPMMEWNPGEAVKNNVFGTKNVSDVAAARGAESFVLVSTDKAVNPSSIMGATKRVAELYVQALARQSDTKFVAVRFGNVLGSTGSVVPIFREQIASGGPVTVTHPDMVRYFMTIPEATALVLQAGALGNDGEILLLDMGEPVRIVDLAEDLIRLSGFEPHADIEIEFTGIRPGEKLFEELGFDPKTMDHTLHPKIFVLTGEGEGWERVNGKLERLVPCLNVTTPEALMPVLESILPEQGRPSVAGEASPAGGRRDKRRPEARPRDLKASALG